MASHKEEILAGIEDALRNQRSDERLSDLLRALQLTDDISADLWVRLSQIVPLLLDYEVPSPDGDGPEELVHNYGFSILEQILIGRSGRLAAVASWSLDEAAVRLRPLLAWLAERQTALSSWSALWLEWNVLAKGPRPFADVVRQWIADLELKGGRPPGHLDALEPALRLHEWRLHAEQQAFDCRAAYSEFLSLLDDANPLIRAGAARNFGWLYGSDVLEGRGGCWRLEEMLRLLGDKEATRSGVVGPFIDGLDADGQGIYALVLDQRLKSTGFDVRQWVLDTLKRSGPEPDVCNAQSFEFYVHEYFEADAQAVDELIAMGREALALEAAINVNQPIPGMKRPLTTLASSRDSRIATLARQHLSRTYQAGDGSDR